ncbi:MAG TPA: hypothetical protein PLC40_17770, partial [Candidatus Hydrogenedentes bacterium]|nr:hypothetical protein [Candidatus Hydrogenedentota bacterium]
LRCALFPDWETLPYDQFSPHQDIISQRIASLYRLPELSRGVLVVPITTALHRLGMRVGRQGISDLAIGGMKCSGNAQRRKRNACLHHGTLLYRVEPGLMGRYLQEPEDRPDYRGVRSHDEFVQAAAVAPARLREVIREAFCPEAVPETLLPAEEADVERLVLEKYSSREWNYRR